jgi:hypothetical protein
MLAAQLAQQSTQLFTFMGEFKAGQMALAGASATHGQAISNIEARLQKLETTTSAPPVGGARASQSQGRMSRKSAQVDPSVRVEVVRAVMLLVPGVTGAVPCVPSGHLVDIHAPTVVVVHLPFLVGLIHYIRRANVQTRASSMTPMLVAAARAALVDTFGNGDLHSLEADVRSYVMSACPLLSTGVMNTRSTTAAGRDLYAVSRDRFVQACVRLDHQLQPAEERSTIISGFLASLRLTFLPPVRPSVKPRLAICDENMKHSDEKSSVFAIVATTYAAHFRNVVHRLAESMSVDKDCNQAEPTSIDISNAIDSYCDSFNIIGMCGAETLTFLVRSVEAQSQSFDQLLGPAGGKSLVPPMSYVHHNGTQRFATSCRPTWSGMVEDPVTAASFHSRVWTVLTRTLEKLDRPMTLLQLEKLLEKLDRTLTCTKCPPMLRCLVLMGSFADPTGRGVHSLESRTLALFEFFKAHHNPAKVWKPTKPRVRVRGPSASAKKLKPIAKAPTLVEYADSGSEEGEKQEEQASEAGGYQEQTSEAGGDQEERAEGSDREEENGEAQDQYDGYLNLPPPDQEDEEDIDSQYGHHHPVVGGKRPLMVI